MAVTKIPNISEGKSADHFVIVKTDGEVYPDGNSVAFEMTGTEQKRFVHSRDVNCLNVSIPTYIDSFASFYRNDVAIWRVAQGLTIKSVRLLVDSNTPFSGINDIQNPPYQVRMRMAAGDRSVVNDFAGAVSPIIQEYGILDVDSEPTPLPIAELITSDNIGQLFGVTIDESLDEIVDGELVKNRFVEGQVSTAAPAINTQVINDVELVEGNWVAIDLFIDATTSGGLEYNPNLHVTVHMEYEITGESSLIERESDS